VPNNDQLENNSLIKDTYTCMILRCSHIGPAIWKMNGWMIQLRAWSSGQRNDNTVS